MMGPSIEEQIVMNAKVQYLSVLLAVSCFATVSSLYSYPILTSRIVGGLSADNVEIPYIVSLQNFGIHFCGGSIINDRTILTAAHCLVFKRPSLIRVHVGSKTKSIYDGQLVPVNAIHYHENFSYESLDFDVGLVRLSRALSFSSTIQPIRLPVYGEEVIDGMHGLISGWGFTSAGNSVSPNMLRYALVPVVNRMLCNNLLGNKITERMFCAGYLQGGIDACQMDSGGPFVVQDKLVGLVSWGEGCAEPNKPGVYTYLATLIPWVDITLAKEYNERLNN